MGRTGKAESEMVLVGCGRVVAVVCGCGSCEALAEGGERNGKGRAGHGKIGAQNN